VLLVGHREEVVIPDDPQEVEAAEFLPHRIEQVLAVDPETLERPIVRSEAFGCLGDGRAKPLQLDLAFAERGAGLVERSPRFRGPPPP
jgi:hypothetical protein